VTWAVTENSYSLASRLPSGRHRSARSSLSLQTPGRCRAANPSARTGDREAPLRLLPAAPAGQARGDRGELEEALSALPRGGAVCSQASRGSRAVGTRAPMAIRQGPNQRWSLDFVSDRLCCGRRLRIRYVIDDFSRECLAAAVDISLSGRRVARDLDRIADLRGRPCMVVSDNGADLERDPEMAAGPGSRTALHRARKACSEWLRRVIQRADARRMSERASIGRPAPRPSLDRGVARRLQSSSPSHEPRPAPPREFLNRSIKDQSQNSANF
jgi:putative transposase